MKLTDLISTTTEAGPNAQPALCAENCACSTGGTRSGSITALFRRAGLLVAGLLISTSAVVHAADNPASDMPHFGWQIARLMAPTASQLEAESKGQVYIYDSLDINQVEAAMDSDFDRIENMMFIRIHHPSTYDGGEEEVDDDGC